MAGWIIRQYNLSVLRTHIIEVYLTRVHIIMALQLAKQITAAGAVSISQTNTITIGNSKLLRLCIVPMHSYYDMGEAMVDCVIVIVYTLHVSLGSFRTSTFYSALGYQEKATETICSLHLMVESVAPCLHTNP